jgi:hypothetical protein
MKRNKNLVATGSRLAVIVALFLTTTLYSFAQTAKTNFSGTWTLNEGKSQMGEGPMRRAASKITITQDATNVTTERSMTRQSGETVTTKEKYNLDGTETDNSTENRQKKSKASWNATGQELTVNSVTVISRDGNTMEMKGSEVFKLSADGKTLTIDNNSSSSMGEFKTTLVYDLGK